MSDRKQLRKSAATRGVGRRVALFGVMLAVRPLAIASLFIAACGAPATDEASDSADLARVPTTVEVNGKKYDVETEYLPRVVQCENPGAPTESLRAQAIAARTYLAYATRGQASPTIATSESAQVMICPANSNPQPNGVDLHDKIPQAVRDAVAATRGQFVKYEGRVVCTFFVAGALRDETCGYKTDANHASMIDTTNTERFVTINAGRRGADVKPSSQGKRVPENRGAMGQNLANCLARRDGLSAGQILAYFYGADFELVGVGTAPTVTPPAENDPAVGGTGGGMPPPVDPMNPTPCWSYTLQRSTFAGECVQSVVAGSSGVHEWYQCDQYGNWDTGVSVANQAGPVGDCTTWMPLP